MDLAFEFVKKKGGLTSEQLYPYHASDETCDTNKENAPVVSIDGHENVPKNSEDDLMKVVAHQPVSVAIDAGGSDFQFYSEGVFTGRCGTELNHGACCGRRLWDDDRWNKVLDRKELMGRGMGRERIHKNAKRDSSERRTLWYCNGSFLPTQELQH